MNDETTIIEEWATVTVPNPPEIKSVITYSNETALLVLDIQNQNCNKERRQRCVQKIKNILKLLTEARSKEMLIIYSLTSAAEATDIRNEVKPQEGESVVKSGVDKFFRTELEQLLKEKNIKKVILIGTSAEGAVLNTATSAAARGYDVIVPVDGLSSSIMYAEQYTVWHLVNSPGTRRRTILTKSNLISIR